MAHARVALITGGGSGIGRATAAVLAQAGLHVIVAGRTLSKLEQVVADLARMGRTAESLQMDVSEPGAVAQGLAKVLRQHQAIDWLVTSAGLAQSASLRSAEDQEELCRRQFAVNFHGARRVMEALLPTMLERKYGRVVHIASSAALYGYTYVAAYCASKHALLGHARAAACELAPFGIAVQVLCPWYVATPMTEQSVARIAEKTGRTPEVARAMLAAQNPSGRLLAPDEVAQAVLSLCQSERGGVVLELSGSEPRTVDAGIPLPTT